MAAIPKGGGTDNVLIDLGCPDAAALTAKPILAKKLNDIVESGHLAQSDAAEGCHLYMAPTVKCRRKIEMSLAVQSRNDTQGGREDNHGRRHYPCGGVEQAGFDALAE
jgi:hypothetical protein